jgi:hypothetical protein
MLYMKTEVTFWIALVFISAVIGFVNRGNYKNV